MLSFLILCYQGLEGCSIIIWGEGRGWHSSITNTPQIHVRRIKHLLVNTCWWLQEDVMGQNLLGDSVGGVDMGGVRG